MRMKTCFKCKEEKTTNEFYRYKQMGDGFLGKCKDCAKSDVKVNYFNKRKRYQKYEKERGQRPERKAKALEYQRTRRRKFPDKYKARQAVSNAIRDGRLTRQPCRDCGELKSEAHHYDYSKPLSVTWLCLKHHREEHKQYLPGGGLDKSISIR